MNKRSIHYRGAARFPLYSHGTIAVILEVGIHIAIGGVGNCNTFKYLIKGNWSFISREVAIGVKATGNTINTSTSVGDTRPEWIRGDIGCTAISHFTHKAD